MEVEGSSVEDGWMKRTLEKRTLERIRQILRMSNKRTTKAAILGWLASLEELPKLPGHKRKTLFCVNF